MVEPVTPQTLHLAKSFIPDFVIEAFNSIIAQNYDPFYKESVVKQDDVIKILIEEYNLDRDDIFANHWLDVENTFRNAGWNVSYEKPAYNESWEPFFTFKAK